MATSDVRLPTHHDTIGLFVVACQPGGEHYACELCDTDACEAESLKPVYRRRHCQNPYTVHKHIPHMQPHGCKLVQNIKDCKVCLLKVAGGVASQYFGVHTIWLGQCV